MTLTRGKFRLADLRYAATIALMGVVFCAFGCDGDDEDTSTMVFQPSPPAEDSERPTPPATRSSEDDPATRAIDEEVEAPPAYITVDGEPYEFPSAKLWLKERNGRIRANLFSDDPPEALKPDWDGAGFWFEMELELPHGTGEIPTGPVSPILLAGAEWVYRSESSEWSDNSSGIHLGSKTQLQPLDVAITFEPLDDRFVIVTLYGTFGEFSKGTLRSNVAERKVTVQAVLSAEMLRE